jgi:putative oxidoreductase
MNTIQRLHNWDDAHPLIHLLFRVILGTLLILKGISFTSNSLYLEEMLRESGFSTWNVFLVSYITFAHLIGGVFIAIGLFTRLAIILQLPILIGAVFLVNIGMPQLNIGELILSILALILMVYFLFSGSGEYSVDQYIKNHLL